MKTALQQLDLNPWELLSEGTAARYRAHLDRKRLEKG